MCQDRSSFLCHLAAQTRVWVLSLAQRHATPWTVAGQAALPVGFSRQEYWCGLPFPPPGNLPNSGTEAMSPASPAWAGGFFFFFNWKIVAWQCWLVSAIHQYESLIGIHMSPSSQTSLPPPPPSHPSRLSWNASLNSLSHSASFHWLPILYLMCACVLVTQSCMTLGDPMDCSPPGSSVHGILQAGILEWVAMPFFIYIWQCMCIHATLSIRLTRYLPPLQCSAPSGKPMKQLRVGVYVWGWLRAGAYVRGWFSSVGEHGDSASFQLSPACSRSFRDCVPLGEVERT